MDWHTATLWANRFGYTLSKETIRERFHIVIATRGDTQRRFCSWNRLDQMSLNEYLAYWQTLDPYAAKGHLSAMENLPPNFSWRDKKRIWKR